MSVTQDRVLAEARRSISTPDQLVSRLGHFTPPTACPAARRSSPCTATSTTCTPCMCSTTGRRERHPVAAQATPESRGRPTTRASASHRSPPVHKRPTVIRTRRTGAWISP
jgi:hypothetical protein